MRNKKKGIVELRLQHSELTILTYNVWTRKFCQISKECGRHKYFLLGASDLMLLSFI